MFRFSLSFSDQSLGSLFLSFSPFPFRARLRVPTKASGPRSAISRLDLAAIDVPRSRSPRFRPGSANWKSSLLSCSSASSFHRLRSVWFSFFFETMSRTWTNFQTDGIVSQKLLVTDSARFQRFKRWNIKILLEVLFELWQKNLSTSKRKVINYTFLDRRIVNRQALQINYLTNGVGDSKIWIRFESPLALRNFLSPLEKATKLLDPPNNSIFTFHLSRKETIFIENSCSASGDSRYPVLLDFAKNSRHGTRVSLTKWNESEPLNHLFVPLQIFSHLFELARRARLRG